MRGFMAAAVAGVTMATAVPALALDLVGLSDRSQLVLFSDAAPARTRFVDVAGISAPLIGIDFRPANKKLYGVAANATIYTIDAATGAASLVVGPFSDRRGTRMVLVWLVALSSLTPLVVAALG